MSLPIITTQPVAQTVYVGDNATFTAAATSDNGALSYQWWESKTSSNPIGDVTGQTSGTNTATLTILGATLTAAAGYFCQVTNSAGTTESATAHLTVQAVPAPTITAQPAPESAAVGSSATFSAAATTVRGTLTWQWYRGTTAIAGATAASYTIPSVTTSSGGNFHVVVGNGFGATTASATVALTVTTSGSGGAAAAPVITAQPQPVTAALGSTVSLGVQATSNNGAPAYQWSKDGVPVTGSRFSGATSPTLTIFGLLNTDAGGYGVAVTNRSGTTASASAALTIGSVGGGGVGGMVSAPGSPWTISAAGGAPQTTAALGVSEITRHRASQTTDTCEVTFDGRNVDAGALYAFGSTVTISRGGVPWFVGRVTSLPGSGDGSRQSQSVTLSGAWWYLEHLVFTQTWTTQAGQASAQLGRAILGQAADGSAVPTGAVITEALNYAVNAGAPFRLGSILQGFTIPFDEVKDVTCAEVVRKMLRWHPDAVAWFDYSSGIPTINIVPRAQLDAVTLTKGLTPLVSIGQITPRSDLQAPAVVIHYEITGKNNSSTYTDVSVDAAPAGATGKEFGAVVLTIPLHGQSSTTTTSPVIVKPIEDELDDDDLVPFLVALYGGDLATAAADDNIGVSGITITKISRGLKDPNAVEYDPSDPDGDPVPVEYDDSLGNVLVQGSITEAMKSQFALDAQEQRITFSYTLDSGSGDSNDPGGADYTGVSDEQTGTLDFWATNAVSSPYTTLTSYDGGDTAPTGLAANYLASVNVLQWSGSVVLEEQTAGLAAAVGLGNTLNIAGSANGAWASMNALIVQEQVQVFAGRTTLTFGPATHLSPSEMIARLRTTRPGGQGGRESTGGKSTANSDARAAGQPDAGNTVGLGVAHAYMNSTPVPGNGSATIAPDFSLYDASTSSATLLGLKNGTVDGQYPTGMSAGSTFTVPLASTGVAWLTVNKNTDSTSDTYGATTAVAINTGTAMPSYSATGPFYIFLGDFSVVSGSLKIGAGAVGIGSQLTLYCGTSFYSWCL